MQPGCLRHSLDIQRRLRRLSRRYKASWLRAGSAGLQWWRNTWDGDLVVELAELSITVSGDVAFCHCLEHIQGTRDDGEDQDMCARSTLGLRKIDDAWKITHEHNSAPFYMDGSGRPALDLQP